MDYFAAEDPVVVAHLPTRGVWTVYPRVGDVFAWLVVAAFTVFAVRALFQKRKIPEK
jgi:apolipoprotein N-acyltransferase